MNLEKPTKPLTREQQNLVTTHMKTARQIVCKTNYTNIDIEDLYQAAYLGLCIAAQRYDETAGASFGTFMRMYVVGEVLQAISQIRGTECCSVEDYADYPDDAAIPNPIIEPSEPPSCTFDNQDYVNQLLEQLTPRERMIIENLYGLNGRKELSIAEIASLLDISKSMAYRTIKPIISKLTLIAKRI